MPARNPEAVRQRAIEAARHRSGRAATPSLDPVFVALNRDELPVRARTDHELAERVRRAEDYAALGARVVVVVVELHSESHATKPTTRAWAITRRTERAERWPTIAEAGPAAATPRASAGLTGPADPALPRKGGSPPMLADPASRPPGWRDPAGSVRRSLGVCSLMASKREQEESK
jgi:hypothetical protein